MYISHGVGDKRTKKWLSFHRNVKMHENIAKYMRKNLAYAASDGTLS